MLFGAYKSRTPQGQVDNFDHIIEEDQPDGLVEVRDATNRTTHFIYEKPPSKTEFKLDDVDSTNSVNALV